MASRFSCTPLTPEQRSSYFDLRGFSHPIATSAPAAQALFDQGLLLAYNFNHPEALKAFQAGLKIDPDAPMLHWGVTYSLSPYANLVWGKAPADGSYEVVTTQEVTAAREAATAGLIAANSALAVDPDNGQLQKDLRYVEAAAKLWGAVKQAGDPAWAPALERYAKELESIAADYPTDADAPALAAEARMNLSPWVHWKGPLGRRTPVKPDTVVLPALDDIASSLQRQQRHPMAAHLLIHLTEGGTPGPASPQTLQPGFAALGEPGADVLAEGPAYPQMGHLTHMPSHSYLRTGRWHDAVTANVLALQADEAQAAKCIEPYMPQHNESMLHFAAAMSGEYAASHELALRQVTYPELFGPGNMADGRERPMLLMLYARWAQWEPLLQLDKSWLDYSNDGVMLPPGTEQFGEGVWHYARALALASAAAHESDAAAAASLRQALAAELAGLDAAVAATPRDPFTQPGDGIGIYSPGFKRLGEIESLVAHARADVLDSRWQPAAKKLRQALFIDGGFGYTEPPRQYQPLKPCLGWLMLQAGRLEEAERVYASDLNDLPRNPWSLRGLQQVYEAQGTPAAAQKLQQVTGELAASWAHADPGLSPSSSCPAFSD
ncbi:hypothetical protein OEZ86_005868 [Tetradesmus obliquus]|nr:hypothetical protein OEZ86_005868 [Tetradesmus obliquus]